MKHRVLQSPQMSERGRKKRSEIDTDQVIELNKIKNKVLRSEDKLGIKRIRYVRP